MVGAIDSAAAAAPQSPPPPPPSPEQVTKFANVLQNFEERQSSSSAGAYNAAQVQNFIVSSDQNGDAKVNAVELSNALNVSRDLAQDFIAAFNTPGDLDGALDANEFANALNALKTSAAPEEGGGPAEAGQDAGGAEAAGGGEEGKAADGPAAGGGAGGGLSALLALLLKLLDKDGDGKISAEELQEFIDKYDANGDGKLDKAELAEGVKAEAEAAGLGAELAGADIDALLSQADASGDGLLDPAELLTVVNETSNSSLNAGPQK